jgi:hypothetical protein
MGVHLSSIAESPMDHNFLLDILGSLRPERSDRLGARTAATVSSRSNTNGRSTGSSSTGGSSTGGSSTGSSSTGGSSTGSSSTGSSTTGISTSATGGGSPDDMQYNRMVHHLYKQTLIADQTIINKEDHDDLISTYRDILDAKTRPSRSRRRTAQVQPVSSIYYEICDNDGSHSSISIRSQPLNMADGIQSGIPIRTGVPTGIPTIPRILSHMMPVSVQHTISRTPNQFRFNMGEMSPFDMIHGVDTILQSFLRAFTDTGERPAPLSTDLFSTFKEVPYSELKDHTKLDISDNCSICLSGFTDNEKEENRRALIIPCGHYFHKSCIKEWLTKCHYKCPLCKRSCDPHRKDENDSKAGGTDIGSLASSTTDGGSNNNLNNGNDDLDDSDGDGDGNDLDDNDSDDLIDDDGDE